MKKLLNTGNHLVRTILSVALVILLVYLANFTFQRFDLTEEKRHSLTPTTIEILEELDDVLFIKVYLKGDFPAEYKRLEKNVREKLDEMKAYAGSNLEYEFINPSADVDPEVTRETYQYLADEGLKYTSISIRTADGIAEKIIFPGALVTYKGQTKPLQILKSNSPAPDLFMINRSINNLEYETARVINEIMSDYKPSIAFTTGHGEAISEQSDAYRALEEFYNVSLVEFNGGLNDLSKMLDDSIRFRQNLYDMIIISDPDSTYTDQEKFLLDQYLVRGGKMLLFMDPMDVNLDSLRANQETMAVQRNLNLADMIYDHGIRFDPNIVIDGNCAKIEIVTGQVGNQPKLEQLPWYFSPVLIPNEDHPITANIDPIFTEFVSTVSVIEKENLNQSVILQSSDQSRALKQPVRVNASIAAVDIDFSRNNQPHLPIAVLAEGNFESAFIDRLPPEFTTNTQIAFVEKTRDKGALLVVSDGSLIRNRIAPNGRPYPLGYDRYNNAIMYGNKEFLLNTVNYMFNDERLINLRSRSVTLRPLDQNITSNNRALIQTVNLLLPVLLVVLLALVYGVMRRRNRLKGKP